MACSCTCGDPHRAMAEGDRATRSVVDHMHIIEALEARDADLAEQLVREHTMGFTTMWADLVENARLQPLTSDRLPESPRNEETLP